MSIFHSFLESSVCVPFIATCISEVRIVYVTHNIMYVFNVYTYVCSYNAQVYCVYDKAIANGLARPVLVYARLNVPLGLNHINTTC